MNWLKEHWFKVLAVIFLIGALGTHPYAYYQALRWTVCIGGAYEAYIAYQLKKSSRTWIFAIIAMLFNPLAPFYMDRSTWQMVDLITATIIIVSAFY